MNPRVWVLVGTSGSGKTTLAKDLAATLPGLRRAVTCTTRPPRAGERDGEDYHFITDSQFDFMLAAGQLVESTIYGGARYGLPAAQFVEDAEHDLLCVLDLAGVEHLRAILPPERLCVIYLKSPEPEELARRMRERGSSDDEIARRLALCSEEVQQADGCDAVISTAMPYPEVREALIRLIRGA